MSNKSARVLANGMALVFALPAVAQAAPLTPARVFVDAAMLPKLIMLGLVAATVASVTICARKLTSGPQLAGGSAFLAGLRIGGPLAGLLGACYGLLNGFLGIANVPYDVTLKIMAPGLAEAILLVGLGLLAGSVAVICHWAVEARIDRAVLNS